MIDFDTVKSAILTSNFTEEQLIELHHAIKTSRVELAWQERNFVPEKVDRIAAVLIGYSRLLGTNETRNKVNLHKHFHKYFTSIAKNVDYYILSWIPNDFQSETKTVPLFETLWPNKLFFKLYDDSDLDFNTYNKTLKLTYLAKLADVEIQKAETRGNFTYDYVIETRLDNYISFHNFSNIKSLEENEIISHAGHMGAKAPGRKWDSEMDSI